jgi:hypothetical protein
MTSLDAIMAARAEGYKGPRGTEDVKFFRRHWVVWDRTVPEGSTPRLACLRCAWRGESPPGDDEATCPGDPPAEVGVNVWGWEPWGLPMHVGMALHHMDSGHYWSARHPGEQERKERMFPDNQFIQNARAADELMFIHRLGLSMPCHDRPEFHARIGRAYGRPTGAFTQPHALWAMGTADE